MKVFSVQWLVIASISVLPTILAGYHYKLRGPPLPPRPPSPPPYVKTKWHMTHGHRLPTIRPGIRPIPINSMSFYKNNAVLFRPNKTPSMPVSYSQSASLWKSPLFTSSNYRQPTIKDLNFYSSSPVIKPVPHYDFHIATPKVPTSKMPTVTIETPTLRPTVKQVGEKGPIHTIPAPNLSLADKPIVVSDLSTPPTPSYLQNSQNFNQYQVNEIHTSNDYASKDIYTGQHKYYAPDPDPSLPVLKIQPTSDPYSTPSNGKLPIDLFTQGLQNQVNVPQLTPNEIIQMLSSFPQQQQQQHQQHQQQQQQQSHQQQQSLIDSYGKPLMTHPQLEALLQQTKYNPSPQTLVQPDENYLAKLRESNAAAAASSASQSAVSNFQPHYQTFNYEEQGQQQNVIPGIDYSLAHMTANYNLDPFNTNFQDIIVQQDGSASNLSPQFVNHFVHNVEQSNAATENNNIGAELNKDNLEHIPDASDIYEQLAKAQVENGGSFYSSLPNKEAADAFANLQAAGNYNNQMRQQTQAQDQQNNQRYQEESSEKGGQDEARTPMRIYVPDDYDDNETESSDINEQVEDGKLEQQTNQGDERLHENTKQNNEHNVHNNDDYDDYWLDEESAEVQNPVKNEVKNDSSQSNIPFGSRIKAKT